MEERFRFVTCRNDIVKLGLLWVFKIDGVCGAFEMLGVETKIDRIQRSRLTSPLAGQSDFFKNHNRFA
jgi:hypothetical protein